jgi:hypothetical protein
MLTDQSCRELFSLYENNPRHDKAGWATLRLAAEGGHKEGRLQRGSPVVPGPLRPQEVVVVMGIDVAIRPQGW